DGHLFSLSNPSQLLIEAKLFRRELHKYKAADYDDARPSTTNPALLE
ncbi:unnamed protein product, partial [Rotaria sp. Silwood1]